MRQSETYFRTKDENGKTVHQKIDLAGNHFVGKKCVNPKYARFANEKELQIGSTHHKNQKCQGIVEITGNILDDQKSFVYLDENTRKMVRVTRDKNGEIVKLPV